MFKVYQLGGSCCRHYIKKIDGKEIFVKEIDKNINGIDNGYKKFFYEIQHIKKYSNSGLFPKIIYINENKSTFSVGMEYCYGGATLSDLIRNDSVEEKCFEESFSYVLDRLFSDLYGNRFDEKPCRDYIDKCYFNRVENRLSQIFEKNLLQTYSFTNSLTKIINYGCYINDDYYPPLEKYIKYLKKDKKLLEILKISYTCNSHHDLCPLNILVDVDLKDNKIRDFKLIDVRGEDETGRDCRHYMYDMGKMLLGLDMFDIFRIFNGKLGKKVYYYSIKNDDKIPKIKFFLDNNVIVKRYINASNYFWHHMEKRNYYEDITSDTKEYSQIKFLFSQAMMYHPDIPCRIIYEHDEEMAILLYIRGMMMIRRFCEKTYGTDPVGKFHQNVDLWPRVIG